MRSFKVGTFWIRFLATFVANPAAFSSPQGPLVSLLRPANNSIVPPTFDYNAAVEVPDHRAFSRSHKEALLCLSTDGADAECVDLWTSSFGASDMPLGSHTVAAWIVDSHSGGTGGQIIALPLEMGYNLSETTVTHFTVVSTDEWKAWVASGAEVNNNSKEQVAIAQEKRMVAPSLLEWHRLQKLDDSPKDPALWSCTSVQSPVLLIGIKTHAKGFNSRDALRRTWLNGLGDSAKAKACAWFLIGDPTNASPHVTRALQNERDLYRDILLGDELNCTDGYLDLVAKTKGFMKFASEAKSLSWQWLMMLDDDVYLKAHNLVDALVSSAPTEKFYAGQVWASHFGHPIKPIRYEKHQNYLSFEDYPHEELPPFAIGPHYILSRDMVNYIGSNLEVLHGVGTLEDVSVASWLQAVDVHPVHVDHFSNVRTFGCVEGAVSLADLTPAGMLRLYEREESTKSRCEGYQDRWTKEPWRHSSETQIKNEGLEMIPWNLLWSNSIVELICDSRQDGVDFNLISPVAGGIYRTDSLTLMVNITRCSDDIQPGLMSEVCVQLDDGESFCAGFDDSVRFFHSSFDGVMVGTHRINVWLRDPGDKHQISSRSVTVDTVNNVASTSFFLACKRSTLASLRLSCVSCIRLTLGLTRFRLVEASAWVILIDRIDVLIKYKFIDIDSSNS